MKRRAEPNAGMGVGAVGWRCAGADSGGCGGGAAAIRTFLGAGTAEAIVVVVVLSAGRLFGTAGGLAGTEAAVAEAAARVEGRTGSNGGGGRF